MRWRGSPSVAAGLIFVMGGLAHACGGKAVDDLGDRSGLGEAGGSGGNGNTSTGNTSGTTTAGGSSTGSGNSSAQGGASPPGYGQGGASVGIGGAYSMPGQGGVGAWPGTAGTIGIGGLNNADPMCLGISRNMPCPAEGYMCPWLRCGLADQGSRDCYCANGIWNCSSCDYTGSPIQYPLPTIPLCTVQADELACDTEWALCQGAPGGEVCACYRDEFDGMIWDCDDPPSSWSYP